MKRVTLKRSVSLPAMEGVAAKLQEIISDACGTQQSGGNETQSST